MNEEEKKVVLSKETMLNHEDSYNKETEIKETKYNEQNPISEETTSPIDYTRIDQIKIDMSDINNIDNHVSNNSSYDHWSSQTGNLEPNIYRYKKGEILKDTVNKENKINADGYSVDNYNYNSSMDDYKENQYNQNTSYMNDQTGYEIPPEDLFHMAGGKIPNKKGNKKWKKAAGWLAGAAMFGIVAGTAFQGVNYFFQRQTVANLGQQREVVKQPQAITTTTVSESKYKPVTDVSDVVENTMPSLVSIRSTVTQTYDFFGSRYNQNAEGSGSGIIVGKNSSELLVVTNYHVIEDAKKIKVVFIDEEEYDAEVKGTDQTSDLAVVSIKTKDLKDSTLAQIKVAVLGNSSTVKVGEMAIAIGNALGYGQSVTVGYVSAKDREVQTTANNTMNLLQTDAAINPGNSGGALLNIHGEVIGINSVKYASTEIDGMGFAIPISKAVPIINDLMNREVLKEEERGFLGITGNAVTKEAIQNYNMPAGVYVNSIEDKGAAKEAGILAGDIITGINGMEVTTIEALREKILSYRVGTKITITLMRVETGNDYVEKEVSVTLKAQEVAKTDTNSSKNKNSVTEEVPNSNEDANEKNSNPSDEDLFRQFEEFFNEYYN